MTHRPSVSYAVHIRASGESPAPKVRQSIPRFQDEDDGDEEIAVDIVEDATHRGVGLFAVTFFDTIRFANVASAHSPFVVEACALKHSFP